MNASAACSCAVNGPAVVVGGGGGGEEKGVDECSSSCTDLISLNECLADRSSSETTVASSTDELTTLYGVPTHEVRTEELTTFN